MDAAIKRIDELRKELLRLSGDDVEAVSKSLDTVYNKIPAAEKSEEVVEHLARDFENLSEALFNLARFIEERFPVDPETH